MTSWRVRVVAVAAAGGGLLATSWSRRNALRARRRVRACDRAADGGPATNLYTLGYLLRGKYAKEKHANYITTIGTSRSQPSVRSRGNRQRSRRVRRPREAVRPVRVRRAHGHAGYTSFGLIHVDPKVKVTPQVCHFGGPTGLYKGTGVAPVVIEYYGNGTAAQSLSPARTGVATGAADPTNAVSQGVWAPGDEGAPVLAGGEALGYYDGGIGGGGNGAGFVVSRLDQWIARAGKALKVKLQLATGARL